MSDLSDYRASIKRLIDAEDVEASAAAEGFEKGVAEILAGNKAFRASQSVSTNKRPSAKGPDDKMSHGKRHL